MANNHSDDKDGKKLFLDEDEVKGALLPSEIASIEAEAEKQVDRELRQKAKDEYREKALQRARQARGITEPTETVIIDLPSYADRILLDNVAYLQGMTYTVRQSVADQMREVMQNAWEHQAVVDGKPENFYRKQREVRFGANDLNRSAEAINKSNTLLRA